MKTINNIEKILNLHNNWNPTSLVYIKSIEWSDCCLTIDFLSQDRSNIREWPDESKPFAHITILFKEVVNIKIDFDGPGVHQVVGFDIINISENNWDNKKYKIEDYENNSIEFYCKEIFVISVS